MLVIATGGTIAGEQKDPGTPETYEIRRSIAELVASVPEARKYARIETEQFSNISSTNITPAQLASAGAPYQQCVSRAFGSGRHRHYPRYRPSGRDSVLSESGRKVRSTRRARWRPEASDGDQSGRRLEFACGHPCCRFTFSARQRRDDRHGRAYSFGAGCRKALRAQRRLRCGRDGYAGGCRRSRRAIFLRANAPQYGYFRVRYQFVAGTTQRWISTIPMRVVDGGAVHDGVKGVVVAATGFTPTERAYYESLQRRGVVIAATFPSGENVASPPAAARLYDWDCRGTPVPVTRTHSSDARFDEDKGSDPHPADLQRVLAS